MAGLRCARPRPRITMSASRWGWAGVSLWESSPADCVGLARHSTRGLGEAPHSGGFPEAELIPPVWARILGSCVVRCLVLSVHSEMGGHGVKSLSVLPAATEFPKAASCLLDFWGSAQVTLVCLVPGSWLFPLHYPPQACPLGSQLPLWAFLEVSGA